MNFIRIVSVLSLAVFFGALSSCALEPIASIEDQQAALGANFDTSVNSKSGGYSDDEYDDDEYEDNDDDQYEGGNTDSSGIETAALNAINAYVNANYPGTSIVEIEREGNAIEVELSNGVELYFDLNGNFLGTED